MRGVREVMLQLITPPLSDAQAVSMGRNVAWMT